MQEIDLLRRLYEWHHKLRFGLAQKWVLVSNFKPDTLCDTTWFLEGYSIVHLTTTAFSH